MNNLHNFLAFNEACPVCGNPLTLYLQWLDSVCFKAEKRGPGRYHFEQFKCTELAIADQYIDLLSRIQHTETRFSSNRIAEAAKTHQMYFFFLCNQDGIKTTRSFTNTKDDYEINIYKSCYWRSTPLMEYKKQDDQRWQLETVNPDEASLVNADEVFSFKKTVGDEEKVYTLQLGYGEDKTGFMFYSVNEEQKKDNNFEPNIFDKTMPLMGTRPDFSLEHREKLIDRFDSWILVS